MRIFVSSRMLHQLERKAAIDAVHIAEHQPLYIETEEYETDQKRLRERMRQLISRCDAFIGIYADDLGKPTRELRGQTAVQYELHLMLEHLETLGRRGQAKQRVLLFRKARKSKTARIMIEGALQRRRGSERPMVKTFNEYDDLIGKVYDAIDRLPREEVGFVEPSAELSIEIEYSGGDRIGLLGGVSEYLFTHHGMNIDHVWGSSQGKRALIHLLAVWVGRGKDRPTVKRLETSLNRQLASLFRSSKETPPRVKVRPGERADAKYGYVEMRTIDAPGQLNTVCKALRALDLSMSQVHLAPAPMEFPRQTVIAIKVPLSAENGGLSARGRFLQLESKLRDLVGVQAIGTRYSQPFKSQDRSA